MRFTVKLAFTLALALLPACGEVQAADFSKLMESFSGAVTGWQEFDRQKVELSAAIDSARASEQLTKPQADDFKQQLDALNQQEIQAQSSGRLMSFVQSISFNKQFNALASQVETAIDQGKLTAPDVVKLQQLLQARLNQDLSGGRLSETDAASIKAELAHVAAIESAFRAESNGSLSPKQNELLLVEVNKVKAKLDQEEELSDSGARTLDFRRLSLEKKINDGLAQSRVSPTDAQVFRDELAKIADRQKTFQSISRTMTGGQVLQVAGDLDALSQRIDAKLLISAAPAVVPPAVVQGDDFQMRLMRTDHQISRLSSSGRISAQDADELRRELGRTTDLHQAYLAANPVLNPVQIARLNDELGRISSKLDNLRQASLANANTQGAGNFGGTGDQGQRLAPDNGYRPGDGRGPGDGRNTGDGRTYGDGRGPGDGHGPSDGHGYGDRHDRNDQGGRAGDGNKNLPVQVNNNSALSFPIISNKDFTDINGYWAQPYIQQLANRGVIGGFPNGTFLPEAKITRAQFAAIAARALKLPTASASNNFTDVAANYWAAPVIAAASNAGLIGGFPDGSFKPEDSLTRAQALVILSKALQSPKNNPAALNAYSDAQAVPAWASQSVTQAANAHIIVSFPDANQIRPNSLTVRGEVAGLMYQTLAALGADLPRISIGVVDTGR